MASPASCSASPKELKVEGVDDGHIVFFDLDRYGTDPSKPGTARGPRRAPCSPSRGRSTFFIDEVQNVDGFEDVLNGLRTEGGFSIFITGSNSYLLSGELATEADRALHRIRDADAGLRRVLPDEALLGAAREPESGRGVRRLHPRGRFPGKAMDYPRLADKRAYVAAVIQEIFEKDIRRRVKIKNVSVFNQVRVLRHQQLSAPPRRLRTSNQTSRASRA